MEATVNIWTVKEFSERWKVSEAFVYKAIKNEGLPLESDSPVRIGDRGDEFMKNRKTEGKREG